MLKEKPIIGYKVLLSRTFDQLSAFLFAN